MDLLKKIQQVAELPDAAAGAPARAAEGGAAAAEWDATTPRAELERLLRSAQRELRRVRGSYADLQRETEALRDDYGAYRAKVQGWRAQAQLTREHSQRAIARLRGTEGKAAEEAFVSSLQEQIAALKEQVNERERRAELAQQERARDERQRRRELAEFQERVEQWKEAVLARAAQSQQQPPAGGAVELPPAGEAQQAVLRLEQECAALRRDLRQAERAAAEAELRAEEAAAQAEEAARAAADAAAPRQGKGDEAPGGKDAGKDKYIRDLEAELRMWRGERGAKPSDAGEVVVPPSESPSPGPSAPPCDASQLREAEQRAADLEGELARTTAALVEARAAVERMRAEAVDLRAESQCREQAVEAVFAEGKRARDQVAELLQQVDALTADAAARSVEAERAEQGRQAAEEAKGEAEAKAERSAQSAARLLRELQDKNEAVRKLRGEIALLQGRGAPGAAPQALSPTEPHVPRQLQQSAAAARALAPAVPAWLTWRRARVMMAFLFAVLVLSFGFWQSRGITDDSAALAQELRDCRRLHAAQKPP